MKFDNFVRGTLVSISGSEITVEHAPPYRPLPDPDGEIAYAVLSDSLRAPSKYEIISYTGASYFANWTTITGVVRGVDGTTETSWQAGDPVTQDVIAKNMRLLELQDLKPFLYVGAGDTVLRKIDPDDGTEVWQNSDMNGSILSVAVSPDGLWVAAGTSQGRIWLVDAVTGETEWDMGLDGGDADNVRNLAFDFTGAIYAVGDGRLFRVDAEGVQEWEADTPSGPSGNVGEIFGVLNDNSVVVNYASILVARFSVGGDLLCWIDSGAAAGSWARVGVRGEWLTNASFSSGGSTGRIDEWCGEIWGAPELDPAVFDVAGLDGNFYGNPAPGGDIYQTTPDGVTTQLFTGASEDTLVAVDMQQGVYLIDGRKLVKRSPAGSIVWQRDVSLATIMSVAIAPIHVANTIVPHRGGFVLRRPDFRSVANVDMSSAGLMFRAVADANVSIEDPPAGHAVLYFRDDELRALFDDGTEDVIASKGP